MKTLKIIKLQYNIFNKDVKDIIDNIETILNKNKLKKCLRLLQEESIGGFTYQTIAEEFIKSNNPSKLDLDIIEKYISILKSLYYNGHTALTDTLYDPMNNKFKLFRPEITVENIVGKRLVNIKHDYPELKGNIDKANVILNKDIHKKLDKSVESFINKCFEVSNKNTLPFRLSLKYDGLSVIITIVNGKIKVCLTRGEDDKGADLTHLFKDRKFNLNKDELNIGAKFEAIITSEDCIEYSKKRNKDFANLRSAIVSIISSSDAYKYKDYITLVPLEDTITIKNPYENGLNRRYVKDGCIDFISEVIELNKEDAMNILKDKLLHYEEKRNVWNFAIDGIVIDCLDDKVRNILDRKNNVNRYQIAYKFPPLERFTKVKSVDIQVGRTGLITPMIYYEEIDFNGAKHYKSSLSSYERFLNMNLYEDEIIRVTYNNDVMPYPNKYECEWNDNIYKTGTKLQLPDVCKCGSKLVRNGANYFCTNPKCEMKLIPAYTHFYKAFDITDISERTVYTLIDYGFITGYESLFELDYNYLLDIDGFGDLSVNNLKNQIYDILESDIPESKLIYALGICGIKTSKIILSKISIDELLENTNRLYLIDIEGIKDKTKKAFIDKFVNLKEEILYYKNLLNLVKDNNIIKEKICFTGFRDKELSNILKDKYDIVDDVTKDLSILVYKGSESSKKMLKAKKYNNESSDITIYSFDDFIEFLHENNIL